MNGPTAIIMKLNINKKKSYDFVIVEFWKRKKDLYRKRKKKVSPLARPRKYLYSDVHHRINQKLERCLCSILVTLIAVDLLQHKEPTVFLLHKKKIEL